MPSSDPESKFDLAFGEILRHEEARKSPGASDSEETLPIARLALDRKLISPAQFEECLAATQGGAPAHAFLVEKGYLKTEDLVRLLEDRGRRARGLPEFARYEV